VHPSEHLEWLRESVGWFLALDGDALSKPVPRCPGWRVDTVYDHLGRGVGLGRVAALQASPDANVFEVMGAALPPPTRGEAAFEVFADAMPAYLEVLGALDPSSPCATYTGTGDVAFWIRRDAIELALHASDIADALGIDFDVEPARASDAIDETIEFVLPEALHVLGRPSPAPCRIAPTDAPERLLGVGGLATASLAGSAYSLLLALWGRASVEVHGNDAIARAWTSLVEEAFRGPDPS
jgi:uncharacterized protein (TIGR03083 family)